IDTTLLPTMTAENRRAARRALARAAPPDRALALARVAAATTGARAVRLADPRTRALTPFASNIVGAIEVLRAMSELEANA
ncbi:MAG: hypothetical protein ACYDCK_06080, partial [Thermoplasmatota archaeon]